MFRCVCVCVSHSSWVSPLSLCQATLGVQEIHSKGLVHMDIKTENIMMNCVNNKPLG